MLLILGCVFCNLQCSMVAAKRYTIQRARTNLCQCQFMKLYRFISRVSCLPLRESQTQSTTLRRQRESESTRTRKISWKSEVIRSGCGLQSNEIPGMTLTPFHAMQKRSLFFSGFSTKANQCICLCIQRKNAVGHWIHTSFLSHVSLLFQILLTLRANEQRSMHYLQRLQPKVPSYAWYDCMK